MDFKIIGAIKIIDGLFIGDEFSEFLVHFDDMDLDDDVVCLATDVHAGKYSILG